MMGTRTIKLAIPVLLVAFSYVFPALALNDDLCAQYGDFTPIPHLDGQDFCQTAGLTDASAEKCLLIDAAGYAFTRKLGDSIAELECRAAQQLPSASHAIDGKPISYSLQDSRPLPGSFNNSVLSEEGSTYHFWWTHVYNFGIAASCAATTTAQTVTRQVLQLRTPQQSWLVPSGWSVHSVVWSQTNQDSATAAAQLYLPLAAITYTSGTLAILVRGTETYQDWQTDFTYSQTASSGPISWPGRTHQGLSRLSAYLWTSAVQEAMDSLVLKQGSSIEHVVVAGHSMGAGVGTLLAYTIQAYLVQQRSCVRVDAMLFAPPNVGDSSFAGAFGEVVNARRIPFESDLVPQLPCSPTVTACARTSWSGGAMTPQGVWAYEVVPGTVALTAAGMPMEAEAWASFGPLYACQLGRYVLATHVCAYQCYLSQYVQGGMGTNMCRLRQEGGAAGGQQQQGSFCFGYPVVNGRQYPYESAGGILSLFV